MELRSSSGGCGRGRLELSVRRFICNRSRSCALAAAAPRRAAACRVAIVVEHAGGPAHMGFGPAIAFEGAIEEDDGPGLTAAGPGKPYVIRFDGAAIEKNLAGIGAEFSRPGRSLMQGLAIDGHPLDRDAPPLRSSDDSAGDARGPPGRRAARRCSTPDAPA